MYNVWYEDSESDSDVMSICMSTKIVLLLYIVKIHCFSDIFGIFLINYYYLPYFFFYKNNKEDI